jgi:hypothetical protein
MNMSDALWLKYFFLNEGDITGSVILITEAAFRYFETGRSLMPFFSA